MEKNKREKKRYVREVLIMALILALVGLTVSYAAVNATLDIAGFSAVRVANWSVGFESTSVISKTGSAEVLQSPKIRGTNIHYEVRLNSEGDSVTIKAVVKNRGTLDAKLESYDIFGVPSQYENNVSYKVTDSNGKDLTEGTILKGSNPKANLERYMTVYITITYEDMIYEDSTEYKVINLGLSLNFVQSCEKCTTISQKLKDEQTSSTYFIDKKKKISLQNKEL